MNKPSQVIIDMVAINRHGQGRPKCYDGFGEDSCQCQRNVEQVIDDLMLAINTDTPEEEQEET